MSIRGHRIGSSEIESVLLKINYLIEVCAVGVEDSLEGSLLVLFVVYNRKLANLRSDIKNILINNFGSYAIPKKIIKVKQLPKTKSGKILRRLLRNILQNHNKIRSIDLSTISNKESINEILCVLKNEKI